MPCPEEPYVVDDIASDSNPGKWDLTTRFLVLGVNALLQCNDPSRLTVMATDTFA